MRRIGLLGGMSWESSALYYAAINREVHERLGGHHSASCVLASVDFEVVERYQSSGDWDAAGEYLAREAKLLEAAGADCIVLCTNTMHKVADQVARAVDVPLLSIVSVTAEAVRDAGLTRVALLGTRFTMEESFYRDALGAAGLSVSTPDEQGRAVVHDVIYGELVHGVVSEESRSAYRRVIDGLVARGAEGVILGCTEIEMLIGPEDAAVPVFPTTALHASAAVDFALAD